MVHSPVRCECFSVANEIKCYGETSQNSDIYECFSVANEIKCYGEASQI